MARQRYWPRLCSCIGVLVVVLAAAWLAWVVLCHMMAPGAKTPDLFVLLAIAPIVSITLIVIAVLVAVFRSFREGDLNRLPVGTAARAAFREPV